MDNKNLTFGNIEIEKKNKSYRQKTILFLRDVGI